MLPPWRCSGESGTVGLLLAPATRNLDKMGRGYVSAPLASGIQREIHASILRPPQGMLSTPHKGGITVRCAQ